MNHEDVTNSFVKLFIGNKESSQNRSKDSKKRDQISLEDQLKGKNHRIAHLERRLAEEKSKKAELEKTLEAITKVNDQLNRRLQNRRSEQIKKGDIPEELLQCVICLEDLRNSHPKVGICGHTLCRSCVSTLREASCPFCRTPAAFLCSSENYLLADLLGHLKKDHNSTKNEKIPLESNTFVISDLEALKGDNDNEKRMKELQTIFCDLMEDEKVRQFFSKLSQESYWLFRFTVAAGKSNRVLSEEQIAVFEERIAEYEGIRLKWADGSLRTYPYLRSLHQFFVGPG